jgi:hypothetical protein
MDGFNSTPNSLQEQLAEVVVVVLLLGVHQDLARLGSPELLNVNARTTG